jgi:hypothetical protein
MYTIQALIADNNVIESSNLTEIKIISLPQAKALIPLSKSLRDALQIPYLPFTDAGLTQLPATIAELCHKISTSGKVAYIEAEFFGGQGMQACSLWNKGRMLTNPTVTHHAINEALQFLGVEKGESFDEFDALDLGHLRETDEWLSEAGA